VRSRIGSHSPGYGNFPGPFLGYLFLFPNLIYWMEELSFDRRPLFHSSVGLFGRLFPVKRYLFYFFSFSEERVLKGVEHSSPSGPRLRPAPDPPLFYLSQPLM